MNRLIQVCEYARLFLDENQTFVQTSLEEAAITPITFEWLLELQSTWKENVPLLHIEGKKTLKLDNYVGILQSPTGETIEVLPKILRKDQKKTDIQDLRHILHEMLLASGKLTPREAGNADLSLQKMPLHEFIFSQFLFHLNTLVTQGLRRDYIQYEEESRFVRGALNLSRQARQSPDRATYFHICHDLYSVERPENRLLKTALQYIQNKSLNPENWRLANRLAHQLADIRVYHSPLHHWSKWREGKLMHRYSKIKSWCELVLKGLNPHFQLGNHRGIALLFPMEKLFESALSVWLKKELHHEASLRAQTSSQYLITHTPDGFHDELSSGTGQTRWFNLKPDFLIDYRGDKYILDAKWKLLDSNRLDKKYFVAQSDLYQLFAYGQKYLNGEGQMLLIYPAHPDFDIPFSAFKFDEQLQLWIVPFDLKLKKLVPGQWTDFCPWYSSLNLS